MIATALVFWALSRHETTHVVPRSVTVRQQLAALRDPKVWKYSQYYSIVFDPEKAGELMWSGWGPDWPNASTVIPELFSQEGGFNLSQVVDDEFDAKV